MYDMYPWNQPGDAAAPEDSRPAQARRRAGGTARQAVQALQVALDRRDNGGASPAAGDQ